MPEPPTPITDPPARGNRSCAAGAGGAPPGHAAPAQAEAEEAALGLRLLGVSVLALISTVFGMLMAVASDLPSLEGRPSTRRPRTRSSTPTGPAAGSPARPLPDRQAHRQPEPHPRAGGRHLPQPQERGDRDRGPALLRARGRGLHRHRPRALAGRAAPKRAQGGSTITQQFVKNALSAQGNRSVFQKLRESALAYHLERQWSKEKILTQYLNTVYFGNGAYGIESAMRTYFGDGDESRRRTGGDGVAHAHGVEEEEPTTRICARRATCSRRGGPARRDDRLSVPLRPDREPRRWPRSAATWCSSACSSSA